MEFIKHYFLLFILFIAGSTVVSAQCTVNAGGNVAICGTSYTLQGSSGGSTSGSPTWTLVSKPSGAPDPVITNNNTLTPNVTGMTYPGNYTFRISQPCSSGTATSQVTITAPGEVSAFTAGPDITNVSAAIGTVNLNGVIPPGYTGEWRAVNIYNLERFSQTTSTNSQFTNTTSASTTFSLIKKSDHDIDPAYKVILKITSINNPNCSYEDEAVVRFIPNPQIKPNLNYSTCLSTSNPQPFIPLLSDSPIFATRQAGASGNPAYGTTVTMNVISQPSGGNISFVDISESRIFLNGITTIGVYKFTLTISNANGTYTTPEITYTFNGNLPNPVNFLNPAHPEQMMVYSSGGSGGAVYCNMAGSTTPITFYFTINPADSSTVTTTVTPTGIFPPGGSPAAAISGAGTYNRSVTITPPAGGWRVGTYRFRVNTSSGTCNVNQDYYIHISDNRRPNVNVDNITICYPGSGSVTATIPLPAVYKGVVNSSYFQDFNGIYNFTLISKPAGASTPIYEATNLRTITNTSTTISNLDRPGEYVFRITAAPGSGGVGAFLDKEYNCSGASLTDTFSVFVSPQINANAGSDQNLTCMTSTALNGNSPGVASGLWKVVQAPSGAAPVFSDASTSNTIVSGLNVPGVYKFAWEISTGSCISSDEMEINVEDCSVPIGCSTNIYFSLGEFTTLYNIHTSTNLFVYEPIGSPIGFHYNAMGINPVDGNLYAIKSPTNILLRVNVDGSTTDLGPITGLPNGGTSGVQSYNSGEIDDQGNYYVIPFNDATLVTTMYKIDITTKTAVAVPLSTGIRVSDVAYNIVTGLLYGVNFNGQFISINPATGMVTNIGTSSGAQTFGSMFGSSTGEVYGISNQGGFYKFDLATGVRVKISDSPTSSVSDGAHCVTQPITFDADLSVTKTDGVSSYTAGSTTTYTIEATNNGPFGVLNAHVEDVVPVGIPAANISYTAVVSGGAITQVTGTQTGAIDDNVFLPVSAKVTYMVTVSIPSTFTGDLVNTVTIAPPANINDIDMDNNVATDTDAPGFCYKPGATTGGTALETKVGITSLSRAGADNPDNWPMVRKGGWLALEAKTKGFVPNRVKFNASNQPVEDDGATPVITTPVEGMMVYDTTNKCLKMYTSTDGGNTFGWYCISTQTCPD